MSAVDLPPLVGLIGTTRTAFRMRRGGRRLAIAATIVTAAGWALTWWMINQGGEWLAAHRARNVAPYAVAPVALALVAGVGLLVRTARVWIDGGGVRWGWKGLHVRMEVDRLRCAEIYRDGVALVATKGSRWFLAARDWDNFDLLAREIERAGMPVTHAPRRAPIRARLQSYGLVLDTMMVATILGTLIVVLGAAGLR
jgi:hypothetical protein